MVDHIFSSDRPFKNHKSNKLIKIISIPHINSVFDCNILSETRFSRTKTNIDINLALLHLSLVLFSFNINTHEHEHYFQNHSTWFISNKFRPIYHFFLL